MMVTETTQRTTYVESTKDSLMDLRHQSKEYDLYFICKDDPSSREDWKIKCLHHKHEYQVVKVNGLHQQTERFKRGDWLNSQLDLGALRKQQWPQTM